VSWFSSSRRRAERLLSAARDALEIRVAERTVELTRANLALQRTQEELSELAHELTQENLYLRMKFAQTQTLRRLWARVQNCVAC
jgi:C4-dicarboxylate-specific signal transduction histidine kinase